MPAGFIQFKTKGLTASGKIIRLLSAFLDFAEKLSAVLVGFV
jgi:hypothetical protein